MRSGLVLAAGGLALVVAELGWRVHLYGSAALSPALMNSMHNIGRSGLIQPGSVEGLHYELEPLRSTHFKLVPFETNSHGMRDAECSIEKPAGTFRIAAVGDSFTMGQGVAIEDVYHSVLERELAAARPDQRFESLNFGVAGYSLPQTLIAVEGKVVKFDPDLVLLAVNLTDLKLDEAEATREFEPHPEHNPFFELSLFSVVGPFRTRRFSENVAFAGSREDAQRDAQAQARADQLFLVQSMSKLAELGREHGFEVLVVFLSTSDMQAKSAGRVSDACARASLPFLDTCPLFTGKDPREYEVLSIDPHPNAAANRMYAEAVLEKLEAEELLPPR